MSEQETEIDTDRQPQFSRDTFANVALLTAIAVDPRGTAKRLRQLERAQVAVDAGRADLNAQMVAFREETTAKQTELETLAKAARAREAAALAAEQNLARREAGLVTREQELTHQNDRLKRRVLAMAGLEEPHPTLQRMPSWGQLIQDLARIQQDAHFPIEADTQSETFRPDSMPPDVTLAQTTHRVRTRRPERVAQGA